MAGAVGCPAVFARVPRFNRLPCATYRLLPMPATSARGQQAEGGPGAFGRPRHSAKGRPARQVLRFGSVDDAGKRRRATDAKQAAKQAVGRGRRARHVAAAGARRRGSTQLVNFGMGQAAHVMSKTPSIAAASHNAGLHGVPPQAGRSRRRGKVCRHARCWQHGPLSTCRIHNTCASHQMRSWGWCECSERGVLLVRHQRGAPPAPPAPLALPPRPYVLPRPSDALFRS